MNSHEPRRRTPSPQLRGLLALVLALLLFPLADKYGIFRRDRWVNRDYGAYITDYTAVIEYLSAGDIQWCYPIYDETETLIALQNEFGESIPLTDIMHYLTPLIQPRYDLLTSIRITSDRTIFSYSDGKVNIVRTLDNQFPDYLMQPDEPFECRFSRISSHWFRIEPTRMKEE